MASVETNRQRDEERASRRAFQRMIECVAEVELHAIGEFTVVDALISRRFNCVPDPRFKERFGNVVETNVPAVTLRAFNTPRGDKHGQDHLSRRLEYDGAGADVQIVSLAHIFRLMELQRKGWHGFLAEGGAATKFHVADPTRGDRPAELGVYWESVDQYNGHWVIRECNVALSLMSGPRFGLHHRVVRVY